jgi:uncharacterized protein (DUF2336 family)
MSRQQPKLAAMFELAHQRSEGSRLQLAGMLADIFLEQGDQLSLREQELVNELIDQLLLSATQAPAFRALLVEKFADKTLMPRKIALSIAHGDIGIAREVLQACQTFSDDDLISVVLAQSTDHAVAIAQRAIISEALADALVTTGDISIMQIVAENLGAQLGPKAITIITEAARFTAALRAPIMKRSEMTSDAAARLYWWVSQDLRRFALKHFGLTSGQIDTSLAKTLEELLSYHELDKGNDKVMTQIASWLHERDVVSARILPQVLRLGHFRLFNMLLAQLTSLDLALIDAIVAETGGRGLAVVCRALGVDKAGFVSFFLLSRGAREGDHVVHPRELSFALAAFDKLSVNLANDLLRSWKQNPGYILSKHSNELVLEA